MTTHARLCPYVREILLLNGSAYRTSVGAGTAGNALVCVDNVLAVTLGDALLRTSVSTCTASDTLIGNLVCHC